MRTTQSLTAKMPSEAPVLPTQTEKPHHYTYLKEFRTQQCPLFLQHKCTQHRPFTCFHWHFTNQRRRRPVRRRDGTFNYHPDIYCTKYDETTGVCPDGDECPFLHRTAGDTERRYHLRYYKTCTCVHETDARGHCVKNGPHCAFAHGAHDLRPAVYDVRELQGMDTADKSMGISMTGIGLGMATALAESPGTASSLEKDRILYEDPKWNDTNYVLANYKTEPCKRPPRLCRQGYACPQYHNSRDRRRSPKKYKYRSTPCPNVKHGDEWGDAAQCESGDNCPYCHTRTEQQFHPEIYKSTKCNDMVQTGYCPRGPFCAFAHVEQEMTTARELPAASENSLAAFVTNALPANEASGLNSNDTSENDLSNKQELAEMKLQSQLSNDSNSNCLSLSNSLNHSGTSNGQNYNLPEPIGKGRSNSNCSSILSDPGNAHVYGKAPGSEREDAQAKLRNQMLAIDNDPSLDPGEKSKRKQNLLLMQTLNGGGSIQVNSTSTSGSTATTLSNSMLSSTMSPHAPSFYPAGETVESVIGNALDEDLNLGGLSLSSIDRDLVRDDDSNSVSSTLSAGFPAGSYFGATSVPVTIPSGSMQRSSIASSLSQSPCSSPLGSLPSFMPPHLQQQKQEQQIEQAAAAFLSQPNPGRFSVPGFGDLSTVSPRNGTGASASPLMMSSAFSSNSVNGNGEIHRLREELAANKSKMAQWEEGIAQARSACDAWKKEAEESARRAKQADDERQQTVKQRDEALSQLLKLKQEVEQLHGGPFLHRLQRVSELETLPLSKLKTLQSQLRVDLDTLEKIVYQHTAMKCVVCQEKNRSVAVMPCNHYVLCDGCASNRSECPYCHLHITQRSSIVLPL